MAVSREETFLKNLKQSDYDYNVSMQSSKGFEEKTINCKYMIIYMDEL